MAKKMLLLLPILPGILAFAADGPRPEAAWNARAKEVAGIKCAVRVGATAGGISLQAVATADRKTTGAYRFTVDKAGSAGASTIAQGGEFSLTPHETELLGAAALGLDRRISYNAHLSLENGRGTILCRAEASN